MKLDNLIDEVATIRRNAEKFKDEENEHLKYLTDSITLLTCVIENLVFELAEQKRKNIIYFGRKK